MRQDADFLGHSLGHYLATEFQLLRSDFQLLGRPWFTLQLDRVENQDSTDQTEQRHSTDTLLPEVYSELRRLAAARLSGTPSAGTISGTVLVHEAFLRLKKEGDAPKWANKKQFFSAAAEAMRRILIDHLRAKGRVKRGGDQQRVDETISAFSAPAEDDQLLAIHDSLDELAEHDPDGADLVKLRFFAGFTMEEIAKSTGISERSLARQWKYVRSWLAVRLGKDD